MNYQTGLNNSVTTHDKSYNQQQQPPYATVGNQAMMANQGSPGAADKDNPMFEKSFDM